MLATEQRMEQAAGELAERQGHRVNLRRRLTESSTLGREQVLAFRHVTQDRDLAVVVGYAGTGKSTMLGEARAAWEADGYRVLGAALSGIAAEQLEGGAGIASRTVHTCCFSGSRGHEPEDDGDAVRAFEALRAEVAALRHGVELVYRQGQQTAPGAPGYSPTLGQMEQALQAIAGRLEAVEQQPALTLTPARFRSEIDSVAAGAVSTISRPFVEAVQEARAAARDLKAPTGRVHERREQRTWLLIVGAFGLIVGVGLWYVAAGLLPRSAGDGIAASLIGGTRWQAGETLMDEASPASFDKMVRLYQACGEQTTELCEAAVAVRSIQPGQEGSRTPPASAPPHPPLRRSNADQGR